MKRRATAAVDSPASQAAMIRIRKSIEIDEAMFPPFPWRRYVPSDPATGVLVAVRQR
jgi:hypothetical protein